MHLLVDLLRLIAHYYLLNSEKKLFLDLCERHSDCDENAKCEFDSSMNLYHCKCEEFYEGNGFQCHPTPGIFSQVFQL
jgi:hypothetical protein